MSFLAVKNEFAYETCDRIDDKSLAEQGEHHYQQNEYTSENQIGSPDRKSVV